MIRKLAGFFTYVMRHFLPDAYLFAILLTFLTAILALLFAGADFMKVITTWGKGVYGILAFTMQMILVLVTGYCLALTPPIKKVLDWVASLATTPVKGAMITAFVGSFGGLINWGFGLIIGGFLALEIARRQRKSDFPLLIAGAYSGLCIWHMGFSGSIPLLLATAKHPQNLIEKATGAVTPISNTILAHWNLIPALLLLFTIPVLFYFMHPKEEETQTISEDRVNELLGRRSTSRSLPARPWRSESITATSSIHLCGDGFDLPVFALLYEGSRPEPGHRHLHVLHARGDPTRKPINYVKAMNRPSAPAAASRFSFPSMAASWG
jgi:short-chain fatty acids transporter